MSTPALADKIIVAVDVPTEQDAVRLIEELGDSVGYYKIGLQLFTKAGPGIVKRVHDSGAKVFLDLKFHDIPNQVAHAVESACGLGVQLLTIHLSGGGAMIREAAKAAESKGSLVLGVTVLTSSNVATLAEAGVHDEVQSQVLRLAALAQANGVRGLVASPHELAALRANFGSYFTIVTPGVRPSWSAANDQQRIMTPREAVEAGSDHLVIGRPITAAPNPREAVERILEEIQS